MLSVEYLLGFIFHHGNEPKHTANAVSEYLDRKTHSETLSNASTSPLTLLTSSDFNIIDSLWDHLEREQNKK